MSCGQSVKLAALISPGALFCGIYDFIRTPDEVRNLKDASCPVSVHKYCLQGKRKMN